VAGRSRTCDAPRFRRPLYLPELQPRAWARLDSNQQPFVCRTSALRELSYSPMSLEGETPGQGFEPRPPRSERGVLAVRRSRKETIGCSCHSPTLRPWIAAALSLPRVVVEAFWSPALDSQGEKRRQKQPLTKQRQLPRRSGRGPFSLRRGPDSVLGLLQAEHHLVLGCRARLQTTKATLSGRPRSSCYAARGLACMPPGEGIDAIRRGLVRGRLPTWQDGRESGRVRKEAVGIGKSHHVCVEGMPRQTIDQTPGERKSTLRKSNRLPGRVAKLPLDLTRMLFRRWFANSRARNLPDMLFLLLLLAALVVLGSSSRWWWSSGSSSWPSSPP
jgi:hypothetical protein